jgi:predicted aldo/keto reductase-like oxidoreductase
MQYRRFGRLEWEVSALGFGAMRLPTLSDDPADIDEPEATRMVRYGIDHGVNYVDTAWPYHGERSEPFLGRALLDGYRDRVRLATKLPCWEVEKEEDLDKYLNEQLRRLQTDHVDCYLLHSLDHESWPKMRSLGVLPWAENAIADGRIDHLGFSFHDDHKAFVEIVDSYDKWAFCQIQYNYMDTENQAGTKGLRYAASKGLAVVVMEPLLGGRLARPPQAMEELWLDAPHRRTPADWALQWLWNQPEVSAVLSGMSTMQHVQENLSSADNSGIGVLTEDELALVAKVRDRYRGLCPIPCTDCKYCLPCPSGVNIPRVFEVFSDGVMHGDPEGARAGYKWIPEAERAKHCTHCQQCEELCPQQIPISEWMVHAEEVLAQGKAYEQCFPI